MSDALTLWACFAALAIGWAVVVMAMAKYDKPVDPPEFSARCQCGHDFIQHRSAPHQDTECAAWIDGNGGGPCLCSAFEPAAGGDRIACVPACRHRAFAVDNEGEPLKCIDCGEELAE